MYTWPFSIRIWQQEDKLCTTQDASDRLQVSREKTKWWTKWRPLSARLKCTRLHCVLSHLTQGFPRASPGVLERGIRTVGRPPLRIKDVLKVKHKLKDFKIEPSDWSTAALTRDNWEGCPVCRSKANKTSDLEKLVRQEKCFSTTDGRNVITLGHSQKRPKLAWTEYVLEV